MLMSPIESDTVRVFGALVNVSVISPMSEFADTSEAVTPLALISPMLEDRLSVLAASGPLTVTFPLSVDSSADVTLAGTVSAMSAPHHPTGEVQLKSTERRSPTVLLLIPGGNRLYRTVPVSVATLPEPCTSRMSPLPRWAATVPLVTGSRRLTCSVPRPTAATAFSPPQPMAAAVSGTPTASVTFCALLSTMTDSPRSQVSQHGEDPAVISVTGGQAELGEDVVDVLLDRPAADDKRLRDRGIGPALGHQAQNLKLARCQLGQRVPAARQQLGDHLRVQRTAARRDPVERVEEVRHVGDPVLEQVPDSTGAAGDQLGRVPLLDPLGQHKHPDGWPLVPDQ